MSATRERIVEIAREWLGTPYRHQASVKGVGTDCIGLVYGISRELNLTRYDASKVKDPRYTNYSRMPDTAFMRSVLNRWLIQIPIKEAKPGDVLFIAWIKEPQHLAILTEKGIIHAYMGVKKVTEHNLTPDWASKVVAAYKFPNVIEMENA